MSGNNQQIKKNNCIYTPNYTTAVYNMKIVCIRMYQTPYREKNKNSSSQQLYETGYRIEDYRQYKRIDNNYNNVEKTEYFNDAT